MELGDLYPAVLTILLIGIILGIGLYIMTEVRFEVVDTQAGSNTLVGVNGTSTNNTYTLSDSTKTGYFLTGVTAVNATTANTMVASDYSNFTSAGVITWPAKFGAGIGTAAGTVNISSVYTYDNNEAGSALTTTKTGLGDFADWIAIIVIVIAAAIVLGIVFRSFGRNPQV